MTATSLDLSQIKTDALSSAATFRTLIGLGSSDAVTLGAATIGISVQFGTGSYISPTLLHLPKDHTTRIGWGSFASTFSYVSSSSARIGLNPYTHPKLWIGNPNGFGPVDSIIIDGYGNIEKCSSINCIATSATTTPLTIQAAASQTANLQEWKDSTGAVLASVASSGNVNLSAGKSLRIAGAGGGTAVISSGYWGDVSLAGAVYVNSSRIYIDNTNSTVEGGTNWSPSSNVLFSHIATNYAATVTLRGSNASSADQNGGDCYVAGGISRGTGSGGSVRIQTCPAGISGTTQNTLVDRIVVASDGTTTISAQSPTEIPVVIKGAASQSAALQQWQDSSGAAFFQVDPNGVSLIGGNKYLYLNSAKNAGIVAGHATAAVGISFKVSSTVFHLLNSDSLTNSAAGYRGGIQFTGNTNGYAALIAGSVQSLKVDTNSTAGETRLLLYDIDSGTLQRVSVGAADSGGTGYKVLRIPN